MKNEKHILVTGGAGFIGAHLVERLLKDGKSVVVIDDLSTGSRDNLRAVATNKNFRFIQSKISNCEELPELAAEAEFIFHLAATVGVELVVKSALHVLEASFAETQILLRATGEEDRGVRRARFMGVLHGHRHPAVLIEGGFLSNLHEANQIESGVFRQKLAVAVAEALK